MKKFLFIAIAALAVFASCKKADPIPEGITLKTDAVVDLKESNFATIEFTSSAAWTAQIVYASEDVTPFAKADVLAGEAGDGKIKLTVESLPQSEIGRAFGVVIMCNQSIAAVSVLQGKVFMVECTSESSEVEVAGGTVEYAILTNCTDVVYRAPADEWVTNVYTPGSKLVLTAAANPTYDERSSYAKFTVNDIQVAVLNPETGEPTGETEPAVFRSYITQKGNAATAWSTDFTQDIALPSTHTIAKFGDKVYVANAKKADALFVFNAETGAAEGTVSVSGICASYVNSIATDDAGNLLIAFGGNFPLNGEPYVDFEVYRINAGSAISAANATKLIKYTNGFYGFGLDNIKVNGDTKSKAAITAVTAVGYDGGTFAVSWQIADGKCAEETSYSAYATLPTGAALWYSGDLVAIHTSNDIAKGLFYIGYDAHYDLCYQATPASEWSHVWVSGSSWAENYSGIDFVEWNGGKYAVVLGTAFFCYWGMPSYLNVLNVNDPTAPVLVSKTLHYKQNGVTISDTYVNETTGDVFATVENGSLAVYMVDAGVGVLKKLVFPVLK